MLLYPSFSNSRYEILKDNRGMMFDNIEAKLDSLINKKDLFDIQNDLLVIL